MSVSENPAPVVAEELTYFLPKGWIPQAALAALRAVVVVIIVVVASSFTGDAFQHGNVIWLVDVALLILWLTVFAFYLRWQLHRIAKLGFPLIRGAETIVVGLAIVVSAFAKSYLLLSTAEPSSFSEQLDAFTAYYFTISTLSTVGFGDISALSDPARGVVMTQMVIGLALIAGVVRLVVIALRINARRGSEQLQGR